MGVERHKKETAASPNSVTVIMLSHLRGNSRCSHSQRDKGTFKHSRPSVVQIQKEMRGRGAQNKNDWWDAWGQWIDWIDRECESGTEICWQKVLIWQQRDQEVCIWSVSMTHMSGCWERERTHRSGYHRSSVISVSRLRFLIVDMAAISCIWKKQKRLRSLKSYAPSKV